MGIAVALGVAFPQLNVRAMAARPPFVAAVDDALAAVGGDADAVVAFVVARGTLAGAQNPHAVVVARLRELVAIERKRRALVDEAAEARRWAALDRAARRGETLRALVDRGDIFADEASGMLAREFDDDDLRGIAAAALAGGQR
jgi:hypothetical protein